MEEIDSLINQAIAYYETLRNPIMQVCQGAKIYDLLQVKKEISNRKQ